MIEYCDSGIWEVYSALATWWKSYATHHSNIITYTHRWPWDPCILGNSSHKYSITLYGINYPFCILWRFLYRGIPTPVHVSCLQAVYVKDRQTSDFVDDPSILWRLTQLELRAFGPGALSSHWSTSWRWRQMLETSLMPSNYDLLYHMYQRS